LKICEGSDECGRVGEVGLRWVGVVERRVAIHTHLIHANEKEEATMKKKKIQKEDIKRSSQCETVFQNTLY